MPEEIRINPKDLKGFAMEFESIYDYFERDPENFESQTAYNFEKVGSQENKTALGRKSSFKPYSPNGKTKNGNDSFKKRASNAFNPFASESDYANLKSNDNEDNEYFLKSRTNSILRILENNIEKKFSCEVFEK